MQALLAAATLLGGVSALWYFYEKWSSRRSGGEGRVTNAQRVPNAEEPARVAPGDASTPHLSEPPKRASELADKPPAPSLAGPSLKSQPIDRIPSPSLPISEVLRSLHDKSTTALQKSLFVERNAGRYVSWEGKVCSVQRSFGGSSKSDIIMVISPLDYERGPDLATATFSHAESEVLASLNAGETVVIEGELSFHQLGTQWSASLKGATLIRSKRSGS